MFNNWRFKKTASVGHSLMNSRKIIPVQRCRLKKSLKNENYYWLSSGSLIMVNHPQYSQTGLETHNFFYKLDIVRCILYNQCRCNKEKNATQIYFKRWPKMIYCMKNKMAIILRMTNIKILLYLCNKQVSNKKSGQPCLG